MISDNGDIKRPSLTQKASFNSIKIIVTWDQASHRVPFSSFKDLINRYFMPTSIYGSAFFTEDVGKSLDKFVFKTLRAALRAHASTNTMLMLEFTGIIRPSVRIQQETISVLCRMLQNKSVSVRQSLLIQFDLHLPFAMKVQKLFSDVSRFPLCGPSLSSRLSNILDQSRRDEPDPTPSIIVPSLQPPYIPAPPSRAHMLAFTDGSTNSDKESGCSVICLIGDTISFSSFYLPGIQENNAAELSAFDLLLDIASSFKATDFPNLTDITIVTDSLNCVTSTHGTALVTDSAFIHLLHSIQRKATACGFKLFTKWVKAHDESNASPFNQLADDWSSRSILTKCPETHTRPIEPLDLVQAVLPLPWDTHELTPTTIQSQASLMHTITRNSILLSEDVIYRHSLQRYIQPSHSNFPGTGSLVLSTASIPGASCMFQLRRDPAQHYLDHSDLSSLAEYWYRGPCPWCSDGCAPTNFHLLHDCDLTKISIIDRRKITNSRGFIFSGACDSYWQSRESMDIFLTFLTSNKYRSAQPLENPDALRDHCNLLVKHQIRINKIFHKWRALSQTSVAPSDNANESPPPSDSEMGGHDAAPASSYHSSPDARLLILNRLEGCRSVSELDSCLSFYGKDLGLVQSWASDLQRPFFRPKYFRQWLSRIELYLTLVNCPTHQIRYEAYRLHEADPHRAYHNTTAPLPQPAPSQGKALLHADIPGWFPKMSRISDLVCQSLLRHTPSNPSDVKRPDRPKTPKSKSERASHHRTVASPTWSFYLNWSMMRSTPLVEAWLAAPSSILQRDLIGSDWPRDWPKTATIQTRKKSNPEGYQRQVLSKAAHGPSLLFLFDLIREALLSGELICDPPFPQLTASEIAKQSRGVRRNFIPYEAAAVMLIFTPIDVWRQEGRSFYINPINSTRNADLPTSIVPFPPRPEVYTRLFFSLQLPIGEGIADAAEWARDQMNAGHPSHFFPALPVNLPDFPEAPLAATQDWAFDDLVDTESSACSDSD